MDHHRTFLHAGEIGMALVFLALTIPETRRENRTAAIGLIVFFPMSAALSHARVVNELRSVLPST
jgi:hypothetical protein